jgi:hypothetical protein
VKADSKIMSTDNLKTGKFCLRMHKQLSYNGINPSVLKSAIQKYIRRDNYDKGLWSLIELDLFGLLENDDLRAKNQSLLENLSVDVIKMNAKKIRSNMINRLIVIMSEEIKYVKNIIYFIFLNFYRFKKISINCWWLPLKMKEYFDKWNLNRNNEKSRTYLVNIYSLLFNSKKLRLISDLKTVFNLPPYYLKDYKELRKLHLELLNESKEIRERFDKFLENSTIIDEFEKCIKTKNEDAFYWLSKLIEEEDKSRVKSIWEIVSYYAPHKNLNESLKFFFDKMNHKEYWIYLYHAILLIIHSKSINFDEPIPVNVPVTKEFVQIYYSKNLENIIIEIDDFIYDLHTGLKSSNLKTKFAIEGSIIPIECKTFFNKQYRALYIKFKEIIDAHETKKEESKESKNKKRKLENSTDLELPEDIDTVIKDIGYTIQFIDEIRENELKQLPQAQRRTANYKKAVYVDTNLIYKGPYDANDGKFLRNLRNVKAVLLMEKYLKLENREKTVQDWDFVYKMMNRNEYYLAIQNVGKRVEAYDYEIVTTKIDSNVKVVKRETFVKRISDIEQDKDKMNSEVIKSVLQHLYFRFLLQIGDSGTHNILLREDSNINEALICGIDLEEEKNGKIRLTKIENLFKQPSNFRKQFYKEYLDKIKIFENNLSEELKEELMKLKIDSNKIEQNIKNWISI